VQHWPAAVASALPQHPPELELSVVAVPPQQPLAAGGVNASAGSPMKPPGCVLVLMKVLLGVLNRWLSNQRVLQVAP
jgi:hypothetical protein